MKIAAIEGIPIRLPRDRAAATGSAGSPTLLASPLAPEAGNYRWSRVMPVLYPVHFESALVKVTLSNGVHGWGEAQAPLVPEAACAIVDVLLAPVLTGLPFGGGVDEIFRLWDLMYSTMRVRGQTGGFMLDAISGIDIALWDIAGKLQNRPVRDLIPGSVSRPRVKAYCSGLPGGIAEAKARVEEGFDTFKLFFDSSPEAFLESFADLRAHLNPHAAIAIDALWRLTPETAPAFGAALDRHNALWLEAPLAPEDAPAHGRLARSLATPLALGESYRTRFELAPFFRENALRFVQPDLGRCGITETLRIAGMAAAHNAVMVPHLSIAMGPQIAAAIHVAAAVPNCTLLEHNPSVFQIANQYLQSPLECHAAHYLVPGGPGLGCELKLPAV